jgi:hypothetical protein
MVLAVLYTLGSVEAHMHSFSTNFDLRFTVNASKTRRTDTMLKVVVGSLIQMTDIMSNLLKRSKVLGTFATDTIVLTTCFTSGIVGVIVCWVVCRLRRWGRLLRFGWLRDSVVGWAVDGWNAVPCRSGGRSLCGSVFHWRGWIWDSKLTRKSSIGFITLAALVDVFFALPIVDTKERRLGLLLWSGAVGCCFVLTESARIGSFVCVSSSTIAMGMCFSICTNLFDTLGSIEAMSIPTGRFSVLTEWTIISLLTSAVHLVFLVFGGVPIMVNLVGAGGFSQNTMATVLAIEITVGSISFCKFTVGPSVSIVTEAHVSNAWLIIWVALSIDAKFSLAIAIVDRLMLTEFSNIGVPIIVRSGTAVAKILFIVVIIP